VLSSSLNGDLLDLETLMHCRSDGHTASGSAAATRSTWANRVASSLCGDQM